MGRRRTKGASAGLAIPAIIVGGFIWLASAAYNFVMQNATLILALLAIIAFSGIVALLNRWRSKKENSIEYAPKVSAAAELRQRSISFARWVPAQEAIKIQGSTINGGMLYFGEAVSLTPDQYTTQYAINPKLSVAREADVLGTSMPYWPSYSNISSQARRAFLDWLRDGRENPEYGIGHVFLFFYGLEHRQFLRTDPNEIDALSSEVRRLLTIYGSNHSFHRYATKFLACSDLLGGSSSVPDLTPPDGQEAELPLSLRIHLGSKLATSDHLDAQDALLWIMHLDDVNLRTPATRCFDDFVQLWIAHFEAEFPNGFKVGPAQSDLSVPYRAASGAFEVEIQGIHSSYPDIATMRRYLTPLKILLEQCTTELEPFSRFVGRNPTLKNSIDAMLLLPVALRTTRRESTTDILRQRIDQLMAGRGTATASLGDLLKYVTTNSENTNQSLSADTDRLGRVLDLLDIAIEPDRRYGSRTPQKDGVVVIFRADGGGMVDPTRPPYRAMKAQVEVGALAATADGNASAEELQAILRRVQAHTDLNQVERLRLIAYAVSIFKSPPKPAAVLRRLAETTAADRAAIAATATAVVTAHDQVNAKEVQFLERLNKALQLPADRVYSDLHKAATNDAPVPISAERRVPGIPIKRVTEPQASNSGSGIEIDQKRLALVKQQTATVSELLKGIFIEEPAQPTTPSLKPEIQGLDSEHTELLRYLASNGQTERRDFEDQAKRLKLLPDGAIERINDWSFDRFEEPLLEDGDQIVLAAHLRARLTELRVM